MSDPPAVPNKTYSEALKDLKGLRDKIALWAQEVERGDSMSPADQALLLYVADSLAIGAAAHEMQSRITRSKDLTRHLSSMLQSAPFYNPDVTAFLENTFKAGQRLFGWVLSADIRNSTELMRCADNASAFAKYVSGIAQGLKEDIAFPCGFFGKFTGDGALGFIPDALTNGNAGLLILDAAHACHRTFWQQHSHHERLFNPGVESGLGIGIDYGEVEMVEIGGTPDIVGEPVVWACRLGGKIVDKTHLGMGAYRQLVSAYEKLEPCFSKVSRNLSPVGNVSVWEWNGSLSDYPLAAPEWYTKVSPATRFLRRSTPIGDGRCEFMRNAGVRCEDQTREGSRFCGRDHESGKEA